MAVHVASRYTSPRQSAFTIPLGIDTNNFNMDWLEGPTNNSDPIWDLSPINSLAFDYDYDHYMNDFKDTLNLEPKAYVIQRDGNDDSMHSLAHSFSVCLALRLSFAPKGKEKKRK
jgi:hypothetical protein